MADAKSKIKKIAYTEPTNYFSEATRKKYGLGEFAPKKTATATKSTKKPAKKK